MEDGRAKFLRRGGGAVAIVEIGNTIYLYKEGQHRIPYMPSFIPLWEKKKRS